MRAFADALRRPGSRALLGAGARRGDCMGPRVPQVAAFVQGGLSWCRGFVTCRTRTAPAAGVAPGVRLPAAAPALVAAAARRRPVPTAPPQLSVRHTGLGQVRAKGAATMFANRYSKRIPWHHVRGKMLTNQMKQNRQKGKNHAEVLKKFRLTRFGWQRRRARFNGWMKRKRSWLSKRNSRKIDFLHRSDEQKLIRQAWYFRLKYRDLPRERNVNLLPVRAIVGSHFG